MAFGGEILNRSSGAMRGIWLIGIEHRTQESPRIIPNADQQPSLAVTFNHEAKARHALDRILRAKLSLTLHIGHLGFPLLIGPRGAGQSVQSPALFESPLAIVIDVQAAPKVVFHTIKSLCRNRNLTAYDAACR